MVRFSPQQERLMVIAKLKQLVAVFPDQSEFSLNEIPGVGATQRLLVSENPMWSNKQAIIETMELLKKEGLVLYNGQLDYNNNYKFSIVVENLNKNLSDESTKTNSKNPQRNKMSYFAEYTIKLLQKYKITIVIVIVVIALVYFFGYKIDSINIGPFALSKQPANNTNQ